MSILIWVQTVGKGNQQMTKVAANPFMPNGITLPSQLDQYISILGLLGAIFHFYSNLKI